ncbi:MAG TPA: o-succinylbenzoate synthase [Chloroflexi bacterium]|jgi:O-succinylbenzoate synthase|nr:o-succinylbenzoate synthase [Chloroflexota bacterium]HAL28184.1 o-succinylbenzoate synthase [Chloroflexota bacterium]
MRIERVELFMVRLPLKRAYETSGSRETHQTHVLARVESEGAVGWGESVAPEQPWYSGETPKTVWYALDEVILPQLLGVDLGGPADTDLKLAWIREHRMAKATIEMAIWDLFAKREGVSLSKLLGGTRTRIPCGVAIGIHPTVESLIETIERELAGGYQRVKLKIKPGADGHVAEAVRNRFPNLKFMLDANSAYTLADLQLFKRIDAYHPMMIEQPLAHDDIVDHATLQKEIATPVCLDESIHTSEDARKAVDIGATKIINIKAGRVGGHASAKRVHDVSAERNVPVWCGGMLEFGIGRAHNVHLASLPNFSLPGDVSASERYFETEIIGEPFTVAKDGTMKVPAGPGIGVTVLEDVIRTLALQTKEYRPG